MKTKNLPIILPLTLALPFAGLSAQPNPAPLVVHEWGTFTSLQNEEGHAIGGINTDDEPAPEFVHRFADYLLLSPTEVPAVFFKGAPSCHPDVTMRLETPVLYFHRPPGGAAFQKVNVSATFRGGWLCEFYPNAAVNAPGLESNAISFGPLRSGTVSTLAWNNLEVGCDWSGPATTEHVWTSPRAVRADAVRTSAGESERFLFYRGVAHIDAPISVVQDPAREELLLHSQWAAGIAAREPLTIKSLWLVDIDAGGKVAFRVPPPLALTGPERMPAAVSSHFGADDYSEANRAKLEGSLRKVLVAAGLFDDEARALLNTWELSYFKSPGLRVFFMVPRAWTDFYLPLEVSPPAEITRVMVGRIELVTPAQRSLLRQIALVTTNEILSEATDLSTNLVNHIVSNAELWREVAAGRQPLSANGVTIPRSYQSYLALGRFRNALILEEAGERPTPSLDRFITTYRLEGYKPVETSMAYPARIPE